TYIVIDSAPSASFTDAVLLAAMVDGLLLVVHSNSTPRTLVLRTKHLLAAAGAKIFGVVLSQVVMSSQDSIYGSYVYQKNEKVPEHPLGGLDRAATLPATATSTLMSDAAESISPALGEPAKSTLPTNGKVSPILKTSGSNGNGSTPVNPAR